MNRFPLTRHCLRTVLTIFLGTVVLSFGILMGAGQELSWAAPGQHPDRQTVPPRPPSPDPTRLPPVEKVEENDDVNEPPPTSSMKTDQGPPSISTVRPEDNANSDRAQPNPAVGLEDNAGLDGTFLIKPAGSEKEDDSSLTAPHLADLSLTKTVDKFRPQVGEVISFTIMIHNSGPGNATNVAVSERLTSGLALKSAIPTQGIFNPATGLWTVSAVAPGQSFTLAVAARITRAALMTNTAQISAVDQFDPDSTPGNNLEEEDDQDIVQIEAYLDSTSVGEGDTDQSSPIESPTAIDSIAGPAADRGLIPNALGSLSWLYALILGILLILGGFLLTNRS